MHGDGKVAGSHIRTRAVVIFPAIADLTSLVALRDRLDPVAKLIRAHITVVFPFADAIRAAELRSHIVEVTRGWAPFTVRLTGVSAIENEYVVVNVEDGRDRVVELHGRLYTGRLRRHLSAARPYMPHLTIGRLTDEAALAHGVELTEQLNIRVTTTLSEISACGREADGTWLTDFDIGPTGS